MPAYSRILLPWDSQPQGGVARIDTASAINDRVCFAWSPQYPDRSDVGLPLTPVNATWAASADGITSRLAAGKWYRQNYAPITTSDGVGTGDYTVVIRAAIASASTKYIVFAQRQPAGSFRQTAIIANSRDGATSTEAGALEFYSFSGTLIGTWVANQVDGNAHTWAILRRGSTMILWRDGRLVTSISGAVQNVTDSTAIFGLGDSVVTGGLPTTGDMTFAWAANRGLTDGELADITSNYRIVYEPRQIWIPVSAAGGGATVNGNIGIAVASGLSGSVNANRTIAGSLGTAIASGLQGAVHTNTTIAGSLGIASASGLAAAVGANRAITGSLGIATASGFTGTVSNSSDTTIAGALGTATASGFAGIVNANTTVAGGLGTAVASGLQGAVSNTNDIVIGGTLGIAIASGLLGNVNANHTIASNLGTAVASGLTGTVSNGTSATLDLILKILRNRQELNPATGTFTLYDDDGTTVLYTTSAWADAAGTVPYSGGALRRIDALI